MKPIYLTLICASVFVIGCNQPETELTVAPKVRGKITFDGEPLVDAKVVFVPQKLMSKKRTVIPFAYGLTDESGRFVLKLSDGSMNISKGDYRVIISKRDDPSQENLRLPDIVNEFENLVPNEFGMFRDKMQRDEVMPARYNENTNLTFKVDPKSEIVTANFDLTR